MAVSDRGYTNLLAYLHRPTQTLPLATIQSLIAHYLAYLSPSPTPLSAALISSPLFVPYSHEKLEILSTASRHAVHFKYHLLKANQGGLFQKGMVASLGDWTRGVIAGLKGGPAIMRLTIAGGLLMGLEDISKHVRIGDVRWRRRAQDEVVLAVAEIMDLYSPTADGWEKEFRAETEKGEGEATYLAITLPALKSCLLVDPMSLAMIQASQSLQSVSSEKLSALPLQVGNMTLIVIY
jgi:hypothetical protein